VRIVSRLVTVILVGAIAVGAAILIVPRVGRPTMPGEFHTYALFRDASGLPVGSRVLIAGIQVGEIDRLTIEGTLARVDFRLSDDVILWDDAWATKSASVFGDSHVEISPGGPAEVGQGDDGHHWHRLRSGEPIARVIEGDSTDRLLRGIDRALPQVDVALANTETLVGRGRRWFDGVASDRLAAADRYLAQLQLDSVLARTDRTLGRFDDWAQRTQVAIADGGPGLLAGLDTASARVASATASMHSAEAQIRDGLTSARTSLDEVDEPLAKANQWLVRQGADTPDDLTGTPPARSGFGVAVRDHHVGERMDELAKDGADYTYGLDEVRAVIGLRNEVSIRARSLQAYVTMELSAHRDRFFYVELERGSVGHLANIELSDSPGGSYVRRTSITGGFRLTAQWGKRLGPFDVRFGLKESTFGVGADMVLLGGRLRFGADLYGPNFSSVPRLKMEAALEVFRSLIVFGGVDDALAHPGYLRIKPWPTAQTSPLDFRSLSYGRDYIVGFTFRVNDEDATQLMKLYGSFVGHFL
jgi:phospholipid/cholesterol/gamma-HCH transport system substrate-binding protein